MNEQKTPEFFKIPAIIDRDGPSGTPLGLFGSGTILVISPRRPAAV